VVSPPFSSNCPSQSAAIVLQDARVRSEVASSGDWGLVYYLSKEKVIYFRSSLQLWSAFLVFGTPASCRNWVLFRIEVDRQM